MHAHTTPKGSQARLFRGLAIAIVLPVCTFVGLTGQRPKVVSAPVLASPAPAQRSDMPGPDLATTSAVAIHPIDPTPTPATVQVLIQNAFPPEARARALAIAWCESRFETNVIGNSNRDGTRDWGVFQINDGGTLQHLGGTPANALDAQWNVLAAKRLYDEAGFKPWTCHGR